MQSPALCLKDLSMLGLAKTKLAKAMLDAVCGVLRQWKYKSVWNGTYALEADLSSPRPSSAPPVDTKSQKLNLSDRGSAQGGKASTVETQTPLRIWKTKVEDNSSLWES